MSHVGTDPLISYLCSYSGAGLRLAVGGVGDLKAAHVGAQTKLLFIPKKCNETLFTLTTSCVEVYLVENWSSDIYYEASLKNTHTKQSFVLAFQFV